MAETLTLRAGEAKHLLLPSLAGAGYRWTAETAQAGVVQVEFLGLADDGGASGGLAERVRLIGVRRGETRIAFRRRRPFARAGAGEMERIFAIEVI